MAMQNVMSRRALLRGATGSLVVGLAVHRALPNTAAALSTNRMQVAASGLRLRSGPGTGYSVLATLAAGAIVRVLAQAGSANGYDWVKVEVEASSKVGYVAGKYLAPLPDAGYSVGDIVHVDAIGGANLRSGPGFSYAVMRVIANGTTGEVVDGPRAADSYNWYKVSFGNVTGWVAGALLVTGGGTDRARVKVARGPLRVRRNPGTSSTVISLMPVGATGYITTDMPVDANGYVWVNVQFDNGIRGWVAKDFLAWI